MNTQEAVQKLQAAGLIAKAKAGNPMILIGAQGYEAPSSPAHIAMFTGIGFMVDVKGSGFNVRWASGPQEVTDRDVGTLEEAVQLILENVPPL